MGREIDWVHVSYIDDISNPSRLLKIKSIPTSIDFCTLKKRKKYKKYIDHCKLVFDSRERKYLYKNIKSKTPIILHDQKGCECIINGKIVFKNKIKPLKKIHVNGAGDLFAGFFIREYSNFNLHEAIINTCKLTTDFLIGESNEKI